MTAPHAPTTAITALLSRALTELGVREHANQLELAHPAQESFGDYSSNIAMTTFAQLSAEKKAELAVQNPRAWAEKIVVVLKQLPTDPANLLSELTVAGPGFINFRLSEHFLLEKTAQFASGEYHLEKAASQRETHLVEYMQPNTNKPLHIGHLRNAILGASLIELLKSQGGDVKSATINNDRGLHIVKSMWGYLSFGRPDQDATQPTANWQENIALWLEQPDKWIKPEQMTEPKLKKPDHFVGHWYVIADRYAEEAAVQKAWQEMLISWEQADSADHTSVRALWQQMNDWFYQGYAESARRLNFHFDADQISYESRIYEAGRQIILDGAAKGIFIKLPDGAIKADLSKFNLPDKILLRRDGTGIYMTFDIELTRQRAAQHIKHPIWVVGSDQTLYFQQLFAVCELLGYGKREQFRHFAYGMVRLPEGKMSSRKGLVVYADDVLDAAVERAKQVMSEAGVAAELSPEEKEQVAEQIGTSAVKWSMLSQDPLSDFVFDLDTSLSFKGFAGPYVQYTYARCHSVLEKAIAVPIDIVIDNKVSFDDEKMKKLLESSLNDIAPAEMTVMRLVYQLPEVVAVAASEYAPHKLAVYLHQLAQAFNAFYAQCPIIQPSVAPEVQQRRVVITKAVEEVLARGLRLLGMSVVPKM